MYTHFYISPKGCQASLEQFRELSGIADEGAFGPIAKEALLAALSEQGSIPVDPYIYPFTERTLSNGSMGNDVRWVQAARKDSALT